MAAVKFSNVWALIALAWRTLLHFVTYPFRRRRGLAQISADFAADGVRAMPAKLRAVAPAALACVGCGKCDTLLQDASALILRLGRDNTDAPYTASARAQLEPVAVAITQMCPYGVNVPALLALSTPRA